MISVLLMTLVHTTRTEASLTTAKKLVKQLFNMYIMHTKEEHINRNRLDCRKGREHAQASFGRFGEGASTGAEGEEVAAGCNACA